VIAVGDGESDIFALFARQPAWVELVVATTQDRALADGTQLLRSIEPSNPILDRIAHRQDQDRESCSGCPRWHRQPRRRVGKGLDGRTVPLLFKTPAKFVNPTLRLIRTIIGEFGPGSAMS